MKKKATDDGHDACITLWPTEASVACRPGTKTVVRRHFNANGEEPATARENMLARVVAFCLKNHCTTLHIREESSED